jgi:serine/threonine protein phosphatase 1
LERINLQKEDQLFLLGDYIDRGLFSDKVLDYIINLKALNYNVFALRGNHENNIINASKEYDNKTFQFFVKKMNKSTNLLTPEGFLKPKYFEFFNSLPYFFELDKFYLVHAGFNRKIANPLFDFSAMLELKNKSDYFHLLNGKQVIIGHNVHYLNEIIKAINENYAKIPLDNGCVYTQKHKFYDTSQTGNLLCLNLDTFELTIQKNIDIDYE